MRIVVNSKQCVINALSCKPAFISFVLLVNAPPRDPCGHDLHPVLVDHDEVGLRVEVQRADPVVHPQSLECELMRERQ